MFRFKLKPKGFLWNVFERVDCWLAWAPNTNANSDGCVLGHYEEYSLTEVKPRWHRMCTPHGYLNFEGVSWRTKALNINVWLIHQLFELHD